MLFVTFLLSGIVLFLAIYAYSVVQLKRHNGGFIDDSDKPEIEPQSVAKPKTPFFDRFKRKASDHDDSAKVEDLSTTVGGVTAKVASSIIESVKPNEQEALSKEERVAPTLSKTVDSKTTDSKITDTPKIPESSSSEEVNLANREQGIEPTKPNPANIEATEIKRVSSKSVNKAANVIHDEVPLERLAQEYEAKEAINEKVTPDEIAQALSNQADEKAQREVSRVIEEEAQQDLLAGQDVFSDIDDSHSLEQKDLSKAEVEQVAQLQEPIEQKEPTAKDSSLSQGQSSVSKKEFKASANAIEIVAKISGSDAVLRDNALTIYRKYDYLFTRHIGIYGKNTLTQIWEDIELADQEDQFDDIAVSLQLADKTGAMTRKESNTFSTLSIEMADDLNKKMEFSMDVDESVEKGRMLDELARKYDAMVVCNIIPKRRKGFRSTDIKSCTKDLQMLPAKNGVFGRFAKVEEVNSLRYSLALADSEGEYIPASTRDPFQVEEVMIFMNVPLVKNPTEAFDSMIRDARKLAAWMDGKIVDKNARNMTARTLDKIAEQIAMIEKEMRLDGLMPGSDICKKLF